MRAIGLAMGFAGNALWRDGENRTETALEEALADPRVRVFLLSEAGWLLRAGAPAFDAGAAAALAGEDAVLLGTDGTGAPHVAMRVAAPPEGSAVEAVALRPLASSGRLDPATEGALGQGEHFLNWHAKTRFCGRCGGATVPEAGGYRRRCTACGEMHFPRTDPVSIMLIHDGQDRCVLGRQPRFPENMWSCLAGFIEPGETLEAAVRRETLEEAGLQIGTVTYHASQPWPFPGSLMIGCLAEATSFDIAFDGLELEACRWFHRAEVRQMLEGTHPEGLTAPQPFAIAHHLIRAFVEGETK